MLLEAEGRVLIENPTDEQVVSLVTGLKRTGPSFAYLTNAQGDYVQVAGSRPWCVVERRTCQPTSHWRAFQSTPQPKYNDGAKISTGAGEIVLQHDEWFLLKDASEIFLAFLHGREFSGHVQWRSMNKMLGL